MPIHPLTPLSRAEFEAARDTVKRLHGSDQRLFFRCIYLHEPLKSEIVPFLRAEHDGTLSDETPRPPRLAVAHYDVIHPETRALLYTQSIIDIAASKETERVENPRPEDQTSFSPEEFGIFQDICVNSDLFKDAMSEFAIPDHFVITVDPWPYGGLDPEDTKARTLQGLVFARDVSNGNADSNHYAYPVPIIPVMDVTTRKMIRIDRLATGGAEDGLDPAPRSAELRPLFKHTQPAEYVPELLDRPLRTDMKPINITQPEGASYKVYSDNLVEWQKWRFRLGFTPREGAIIHDLCYENRPVIFRLSYSELTVPYGDPRPPFHRKQAFDQGDGGFGRVANNLELGCDCLGAIHYFDAIISDPTGNPALGKAVVCLHEQDNGIGWKHTNFRTNRAVVTRLRELVIQCIVTLANYEYIFAYKLDTAGGITVETRATGIVSVVGIDEGKTSNYGTIVSPGVLAQNHQHIFAVRIDPAIDSYADGETRIAVEDTIPKRIDPQTNPFGNYYEVQKQVVERPRWVDAEPRLNRVIKFENAQKKNPISGRNVGYKLVPPASQMLLADPESVQARRARYAQHNVWVTGYRDGELWAAGEYTNQSTDEVGGVLDMTKRGDWFSGEQPAKGAGGDSEGKLSSPVVWSVFGLTHNPRVEDWPVMPVEIHQMHIRPADFFTSNPALDVPGTKNDSSVAVPCCGSPAIGDVSLTSRPAGNDAVAHLQSPGPDVMVADSGAAVLE